MNLYVIINYSTEQTISGDDESRVYITTLKYEVVDLIKDVVSIAHIIFMIF